MSRHSSRAARIAWVAVLFLSTRLAVAGEPPVSTPVPTLVRSAAPDWPQWRGPRRDGISEETGLLPSWPPGGPKCLGKISGIGRGYSSPIVVNDTLYVTGDEEGDLVIHAFSLDGSLRWRSTNGAAWQRSYPGARASCTYDDGKLYHINAHGRIVCLDAATGTEVWAVNVLERFEAQNITWGICESLLIDGDRVFVTPAGAKGLMAALDKRTGATVWASPPLDEEQPSYASPVLIAVGQRRLLVHGGALHAFAVDADSGELCWKMRHLDPKTTIVTTPILWNDRLIFTNASREFGGMYGVRFDGVPADRAWSADLKVSHGGLVCADGRLCGASSRGVAEGWVAVDSATGTPTHVGQLPPGSVVYADRRYYCLTEQGTMTLQELTEDGFRTTGSFQLADQKDVWAHPVVCQGRLFLRYHDTLFCYDVRR
ncbi:MAG TPA: PQQ-binding-like beta-propeller repeat protein [Thermoguttaceae bacterium]|nr:PQQ-binding-like beta-propeller repeat protein [Thermoguttaceae bacterium]